MKKYVKDFLHRGLIFGGFGPIVLGVVYVVISNIEQDFSLTSLQVLLAIVSTYFLAFVQAGASVFNQIESWSMPKSLFCHFSLLYVTYTVCYLANTWIPFNPDVLLVFSLIFAVSYFAIWTIVFLSIKATSKKFNSKLK